MNLIFFNPDMNNSQSINKLRNISQDEMNLSK